MRWKRETNWSSNLLVKALTSTSSKQDRAWSSTPRQTLGLLLEIHGEELLNLSRAALKVAFSASFLYAMDTRCPWWKEPWVSSKSRIPLFLSSRSGLWSWQNLHLDNFINFGPWDVIGILKVTKKGSTGINPVYRFNLLVQTMTVSNVKHALINDVDGDDLFCDR